MRKFLSAFILLALLTFAGTCLANAVVISKTILRGDYVDVKYPVLSNLEDKKMQKAINLSMEKTIKELIKKERDSDGRKTITGNYKVTYNEMDTLSIKMTMITMPKKGAYPTSIVKGFNYDLQTGDLLQYGFMQNVSLDDVNKALGQYLKVNNIVIAEFSGIDFVPSDFYIDEKGELVSVIQEQTIAPHAVGIIEFKVF